MNKIAAVVVTYNKKDLLVNSIQGLLRQELLPSSIIIVDNCSTDGTIEILLKNGWINPQNHFSENQNIYSSKKFIFENKSEVDIEYIKKFENDGGAGGFYLGMKHAYNSGADWVWLMDDDGVADKNELKHLIKANLHTKIEYLNALVVDIDNTKLLSFGLKGYQKVEDIKEKDYILDEANPFNGTLISKNIISKIGFVKKEMFIWGDESEYLNRVKKNNFKVATVLNAKHMHPQNKGVELRVFSFLAKPSLVIKPSNRAKIYYRNLGFLKKEYGSKKDIVFTYILYTTFFLTRFKFKSFYVFTKSFFNGLNNNFNSSLIK